MKKAIILFFVCISFFSVRVAVAELSPKMKGMIKDRYEGKAVILRRTINRNRKVYVNVSGKELYYVHLKKALFPVRIDKPVTLTVIDFQKDSIETSFIDEKGKKGKINFHFGRTLSDERVEKEFRVMLNSAFQLEKLEKPFIYYVGNTESKIFHIYGSNHLPDKQYRILFVSRAEAEKAGYRECPVCFKIYPEIPGYDEERALGVEMAARLRYYYPLSIKGKLQEKLQATGKKVLANWPFPKKGYSYEFNVVQGEDINAWAVPTGFVFVSSELLNMTESDEELEAILAHEITHIERRHGYREYQSAMGAVIAGGILGLMAAAAGAETGTLQIIDILYNIAARLVLFGYSRDNEREADIFAKLYLIKIGKGKQKLLLSLKKIKYLEEGLEHKAGGVFSTHPGIEERIDRLEATRVSTFEKDNVFMGFDNKGSKVAELHLLWEKLYKGAHWLNAILTVEKAHLLNPFVSPPTAGPPGMDTSLVQEKMELGILWNGKKLKFDVRRAVVEGLNAEVSFTKHSATLLARPVESLTFNLKGIERWEMIRD